MDNTEDKSPNEQTTSQSCCGGKICSFFKDFDCNWFINRIILILKDPTGCWNTIKDENLSIEVLYKKWILVLLAIPPIFSFLSTIFYGDAGFFGALLQSILQYILMVAIFSLGSIIIEFISPKFEGTADKGRGWQLLAFSYAPSAVVSIIHILPLGILGVLIALGAGIYSLYTLYQGITPLMNIPLTRRPAAFITFILAVIGISVVFALVISGIGLSL